VSFFIEMRCEKRGDGRPNNDNRCWSDDNDGPMDMAEDSLGDVILTVSRLTKIAKESGWKNILGTGWVCPGCQKHMEENNPMRKSPYEIIRENSKFNPYPFVDHSALSRLSADIHQNNIDAGWWDKPREDGTLLMLMVSEIAEAMEGLRKDLMDDKLSHYKMVDVELADALIRILDYCGSRDIDIGQIVAEKRAFNFTRADHQRENRATEHGKKF